MENDAKSTIDFSALHREFLRKFADLEEGIARWLRAGGRPLDLLRIASIPMEKEGSMTLSIDAKSEQQTAAELHRCSEMAREEAIRNGLNADWEAAFGDGLLTPNEARARLRGDDPDAEQEVGFGPHP